MMWDQILDLILKWAVPAIGAGLIAWLLKPLINTYSAGKKKQEQEEWNCKAKELKEELEQAKEEHNGIRKEILDSINRSDARDSAIELKLIETQNLIKESTGGMREALLEIHLRNLVEDSKYYLSRKYITPEEWERYVIRYNTYHSLGGDGLMDKWYEKVNKLPCEERGDERLR